MNVTPRASSEEEPATAYCEAVSSGRVIFDDLLQRANNWLAMAASQEK